MSCLKIPKDSKLKKEMISHFKDEKKANRIYNAIIAEENVLGEASFNKWLEKKEEFETYSNGEPTLDVFLEWEKYLNHHDKVSKVFSTYDFQTTPIEFLQLSKGITVKLLDNLYKSNLGPVDLFEKDVSGINVNNLVNNAIRDTFDDMMEDYKSYIKKDRNERIVDIINAAQENPKKFASSYLNYLKVVLNIDIDTDAILNDNIEENEEKQTKDSAFDKSSDEYSMVDNAPNVVKLLIYSLKDPEFEGYLNELGLPYTVDYTKTFNYIQQELASVPGDIVLQTNKLKELSEKNSVFNELLLKLNFGNKTYIPSSDPKVRFREQQLRTAFVNQFNSTKSEYTLHLKKEDGSISLINSNIDRIENIILSEWKANFQKILSETPNLKEKIVVARNKQQEWLHLLGIDIDPKTVSNKIKDAIYNWGVNSKNNINDIFDVADEGVKSQILEIARSQANINSETTNHQHFNADGKLVYGITLNTYLSTIIKDLAYYAGNRDMLFKHQGDIFDSNYSQNSIWLRNILNGDKIQIGVYDGFKTELGSKLSKTSKDLKETDINVQRIIGMLIEGKYPFIRSADRSTENHFSFSGKKGRDGLMVNSINEAKVYLLDHLQDELNAMFENQDIAFYKNNNKEFRVFYIENEKGQKESLFEYVNPEIKALKEKLKKNSNKELLEKYESLKEEEILNLIDGKNSTKVESFIDTLISQLIEKESSHLDSHNVFKHDGKSYVYLDSVVNNPSYNNIETVKELFIVNSFIGNIEQTKVLVGDLALYKNPSDVFKRMSMLNSTKNPARTDTEMDKYLNSLEHNQTKKKNINSSIRTITVNDVESNISEFSKDFDKLLKDVFKKDYSRYAKVYNDMNEADGFAIMTYDEYRIASIRMNEWSQSDENLYQTLTSENLSKKEMYNQAKQLMRNITPKKYQYTGRIKNQNGVNAVAGRKFSIIPLVPGLYDENSVLNKINSDMIENEVDMIFYKSAAKFGFNSETQDVYDSSGNYNLDMKSSVIDELDYKYMGNQLKIHNKGKEKITASTQKRKILYSNFYKNGEPINEEISKLIEDYIKLQSKIISNNYEDLQRQLGVQDTGEVEIDNLVNILVLTGIEQGYNTNELDALQFLSEIEVLDVLPNKSRIEALVMAKMKSIVISSKRKGDAVAQIPDVAFEVNETTSQHSERHNLKFYRRATETNQMLPMEIMVALPKDLIKYVAHKYGDGKYTQSALDAFNRDIEKDTLEFEKTGKIETELSKILTYVGFRIPNQAPSSSDVARVKKFLPPYVANSVVVPKPIVAKTGSDFDIDKLNLYKPNYKVIYSNEDSIIQSTMKSTIPINKITRYLNEYGIEVPENTSIKELNRIFAEKILLSDIELENKTLEFTRDTLKLNLELQGEAKSFKYISDETSKGIDNQLLEKEIEITLHKENEKQLLAPLTDLIIQDIVAEIRGLRGQDKNSDHISDVFTNSKNVEKFISFLSGKGGVGQVAVHITNHVLAQKAGLKMKALHNYFGKENEIDLGRIENDENQNISELLSELLTAYVDIAKDPYILDINAIQSTANTILMMLRWGLNPRIVFKFMNQPIIKDYVIQQAYNESIVNEGTDYKLNKWDNKERDGLVTTVMKKYNSSIKESDLISWNQKEFIETDGEKGAILDKIYDDITEKELDLGIKNNVQNASQIKYLDLFLEYQRQSTIFQTMIRSTSPDTQSFKNFTTLENQLKLREEVQESEMFINYDKMFDGFIGEYYNKKKDFMNAIKKVYLSQKPEYKKQIDALKDLYVTNTLGLDAKEKIINTIENELISFAIAQNNFDFKKAFPELFTGQYSIPKTLKKIQLEFKEVGEVNRFLDLMIPIINTTGKGFDNLKPATKKTSLFDDETIISYFRELESYDEYINTKYGVPNFSKRLLAFSIIQSGINNSPYSYMKFIPSENYFNFVKDGIRNAMNGGLNIDEFASIDGNSPGQFLLNNLPNLFNKFRGDKNFMVKYVQGEPILKSKQGLSFAGLGAKPLYSIYTKVLPKETEVTPNTNEENNPLNCTNNKS